MWDLTGPGLEPVSPALAGRFLTTASPRMSLSKILKGEYLNSYKTDQERRIKNTLKKKKTQSLQWSFVWVGVGREPELESPSFVSSSFLLCDVQEVTPHKFWLSLCLALAPRTGGGCIQFPSFSRCMPCKLLLTLVSRTLEHQITLMVFLLFAVCRQNFVISTEVRISRPYTVRYPKFSLSTFPLSLEKIVN